MGSEEIGIRVTVYLACIFVTPAVAVAGLYGPHEASPFTVNAAGQAEALTYYSDGTGRFPLEYARVGNIGDSRRNTPERVEVLGRYNEWNTKDFKSPDRWASLAADGIRTRNYDSPIHWLNTLSRDRNPKFAVLANLAHAYAMKGEWSDALRIHESALLDAEFPTDIPNAKWLQRVEKDYYHRWLKLHDQESRRPVSPSRETVFPLFEGPPPPDAIAIVQQLLLWAPDDNRLFWLLAELYSQANQPRVAERLFDSLASQDRQQSNRTLMMEHRAAVKRLVASLPKEVEANVSMADPPDDRSDWEKLGISDLQLGLAVAAFGLAAVVLLTFQIRKLRRRLGSRR